MGKSRKKTGGLVGWKTNGRRIEAEPTQMTEDGRYVLRIYPGQGFQIRMPEEWERARLPMTLPTEPILELDRGDDEERRGKKLVPVRELYPLLGVQVLACHSGQDQPLLLDTSTLTAQ